MTRATRSEEHTSELQSRSDLVCRLLLEKKKPAASEVMRLLAPAVSPHAGDVERSNQLLNVKLFANAPPMFLMVTGSVACATLGATLAVSTARLLARVAATSA